MKIICKLFGHRPEEGYYKDDSDGNSSKYFEIGSIQKDGLGVLHASLWTKCRRCKKIM